MSDEEYNNILKEIKQRWIIRKTSVAMKELTNEMETFHEKLLCDIAENDEERDLMLREYREWCAGDKNTRDRLDEAENERFRKKPSY